MNKLWAVVTCMGRLSHVKASIASVSQYTGVQYLLVDHECPDKSGDWVEQYHPEASVLRIKARDRVGGRPLFNKPVALNAGADFAFSHGATHILFVDADTIVQDLSWVLTHLSDDHFMIPDIRANDMGLYGLLVVPKAGFERSGRYDENLLGYGVEDIDMRLRLYYHAKLGFNKIPVRIGRSIPHHDRMRTLHYRETQKEVTQRNNMVRMHDNFRSLGISLEDKYEDPAERQVIKELAGL